MYLIEKTEFQQKILRKISLSMVNELQQNIGLLIEEKSIESKLEKVKKLRRKNLKTIYFIQF